MIEDTLEQYPRVIPIKVIGQGHARFELAVLQIIEHHVPQLNPHAVRRRASRRGKYTAVTVNVPAQSREQLVAIYRDIAACPGFIMAL